MAETKMLTPTGTGIQITTRDGFNFHALITAYPSGMAIERGYNTICSGSWLIDPKMNGRKVLDILRGKGLAVIVNYHRAQVSDTTAVFCMDMKPVGVDAIALLDIRGAFSCTLVGIDDLAVQKAHDYFRALFPKYAFPRKPDEPKSHVNFWMMTPQGPSPNTRLLDVTTWKDVANNYPTRVATALADLVNYKADKSGQIVMLHGAPGVGKTWLLRALAWEWQPWCTMHYVMDPDALLNGSPLYMTELLFSASGPDPYNNRPRSLDEDENGIDVEAPPEGSEMTIADTPQFSTKPKLFGSERWRLIILEDTGELMTLDAAARTGQGLGRLLNSADGMLGQGSRVLFLITTNEPFERIHPAVARPGRALANIHFDPFPPDEAKAWVKAKGGDPEKVKGEQTLAQMYTIIGEVGTKQVSTEDKGRKGFGFSFGSQRGEDK